MLSNRIFCLLFCVFLSFNMLEGQITNPDEIRKELLKRDISQEEIDKRLNERGIDINKIDASNPSELAEVEIAVQDIIAEIEAEKAYIDAQQTMEVTTGSSEPDNDDVIDEKLKGDVVDETPKATIQENIPPDVKVYGQELFREYVKSEQSSSKPPANYIIGVGDEIGVAIFGPSEASFSYEIKEDGYIQPRSLGRIYLKGLTFGQAQELLKKRFARFYSFSSEEFAVTINYARQITVNVVGNVLKPGSYSISAVKTAIDALALAQGPSDIGSMRKIKIVGNEGTKNLDLYKFLQNPSTENKFFLNSNDYIHVPTFDKQVNIEGAVQRPMIYELIDQEGLKSLIEYAGGLTAEAYSSNIQITRFVDNEKKVIDVDYSELLASNSNFQLLNGDDIFIKKQVGIVKNSVRIEGAVTYPGDFELTSGMKVTDLLNRSEVLEEAYLPIAFIQRANRDSTVSYTRLNLEKIIASPSSDSNLTLRRGDRLRIYFQSDRTTDDESNFVVRGAVQNPGVFQFGTGETVKIEDGIQIAGGVRQDAKKEFAYLIRKNAITSEPEYIRFNLDEILDNPNSDDNVLLNPGDTIEVFSYQIFEEESYVDIIGAVREPGEYQWDESLTLQDVLSLSGGVKLAAAKNRVEVFRLIVEDNQPTKTIVATLEIDKDLNILKGDAEFSLAPYDIIAVRYIPGFNKQEMVSIQGEANYVGTYPIIEENERISDLIIRAGGLTRAAFPPAATLFRIDANVGYVVIDLKDILKNPNSRFNITLKKGDILYIPKAQELVIIKGATRARDLYLDEIIADGKISVPFLESKNAREYVNEYAAGFADNARRGKISVQHPNGQIENTLNLGIVKIYPKIREGSTIIVPLKKKKKKKEEREPTDWGKVVANTIAQVTAVITLVVLIQRLE